MDQGKSKLHGPQVKEQRQILKNRNERHVRHNGRRTAGKYG